MTDTEENGWERSPLAAEHLLLGALLGKLEEEGIEVPLSYGDDEAEYSTLRHGVGISDLSGLYSLRMAGEAAQAFAEAAFAGKKLDVGECAFEAVLLGDGRLCSVPLLARTGDAEYVLWDAGASADTLAAWLSFLSDIEQDGYRPYEGLALEETSESLVPLLLCGADAGSILEDYMPEGSQLPSGGHIQDIALDGHIPSLVAAPPADGRPCYLVLADPSYARIVWRSLLSFRSVHPVGQRALRAFAAEVLPPLALLEEGGPALAEPRDLRAQGLVRTSSDFIGARAFSSL